MDKVQIGELKRATNSKPKVGANAEYKFCILTENEMEDRYMFTLRELDVARDRANKNREDWYSKQQRPTFLQRLFRRRR